MYVKRGQIKYHIINDSTRIHNFGSKHKNQVVEPSGVHVRILLPTTYHLLLYYLRLKQVVEPSVVHVRILLLTTYHLLLYYLRLKQVAEPSAVHVCVKRGVFRIVRRVRREVDGGSAQKSSAILLQQISRWKF